MNDKVSIIIPTFNREHLLVETLTSIKNQTFSDWECIIVDDLSTDLSLEVCNNFVKNDSRFKSFVRPKDRVKGANACRNFGIEQATGDYLMFFDSDDLLKENCLENRISEFKKNSNCDMIIFSMGIFDYQTKPQIYENRKVINLDLKETINEFLFSNILPWNVCRPIFKTSFIKGKIFFNEKIHNFQDNEFNLRLLHHLKPNYLSIDYTDCYYRFDSQSVNKYCTKNGFQNLINSLYEYYKTVFIVLDEQSKNANRDQLIHKLFIQIKSYVRPNNSVYELNKTIQLFKNEINLSLKEVIALNLIKTLNQYFFYFKGYHLLSKKCKEFFLKKMES